MRQVEFDTGDGFDGERLFMLHALQCVTHQSYKEYETYFSPRMAAREHKEKLVRVRGGLTMEFCVGQWWSSLGDSKVFLKKNGLTACISNLFCRAALSQDYL
jgi:hypothetical protein